MSFHTLRKDKGTQRRLRTRGEAQKGVAKGGGSLDYASKKYFKCYILCGKLVKVNFKKENARLHFFLSS